VVSGGKDEEMEGVNEDNIWIVPHSNNEKHPPHIASPGHDFIHNEIIRHVASLAICISGGI
jgi:hypothetical protein